MSSLPPGDRHRNDGGHCQRAERSHDHLDEADPAYAGETLDAHSPQVEMHMPNPPTAEATSSGTVVTDDGTESDSSSGGDDHSDGDAEDDASSSGSSPPDVVDGESGVNA